MGKDKANLSFMGQPLIQRILQRGQTLAGEVLVVTNHPEDFAYLRVPLAMDILPPAGPLIGLYTALHKAQTSSLVAVGCDMPFINTDLLAYQLDILENEVNDLVIPQHAGGLEPLHAAYRRETCLAAVEAALEEGERSLTGWLDRVKARRLPESLLRSFDPDLQAFINLNTPQEYQLVEGVPNWAGLT